MQVLKTIAILSLLFLSSSNLSKAQTSNNTTQVDELKSLVMSQQKILEHQQTQIEALQHALAEQKEMLVRTRNPRPSLCTASKWYSPETILRI